MTSGLLTGDRGTTGTEPVGGFDARETPVAGGAEGVTGTGPVGGFDARETPVAGGAKGVTGTGPVGASTQAKLLWLAAPRRDRNRAGGRLQCRRNSRGWRRQGRDRNRAGGRLRRRRNSRGWRCQGVTGGTGPVAASMQAKLPWLATE